MNRFIVTLGAALIALAAPASAATQTAAGPPSEAAIAAARAAIAGTDFERIGRDRAYAAEILRHLDLLGSSPATYAEVGIGIEMLRLRPLLVLERPDEVQATLDRMIAMRPDRAEYYHSMIYASLSIEDLGRFTNVIEVASRNVRGPGWAELRESLDEDMVWQVIVRLREQDKPARVRLASALFRIGWPGGSEGANDPLRMILIDDALERGDREAATGYAAGISAPATLAPLLILKRYDGLIPEPGDRLAPLRAAIEAQEVSTADAVRRDGQNLEHRLDRIQHLRALGRNADAVALAQPQLRDPDATALESEKGMWIVNEAAYALLDLGQPAEAARLMRGFIRLPVSEHQYLISSIINHGVILNEAGLHAESLVFAQQLDRDFAQHASDYGDMWMRATIVCAYASLGRGAEAAPVMARMAAAADTNQAAMMRAHLCLNDLDSAERLIISRLEGDDPEEAVMALQNYALEARRDPLFERLIAVRERPSVRAALERVARVVELPLARTYWGGF